MRKIILITTLIISFKSISAQNENAEINFLILTQNYNQALNLIKDFYKHLEFVEDKNDE